MRAKKQPCRVALFDVFGCTHRYEDLREKAREARAKDNAQGWFWEGDDVLAAVGITAPDGDTVDGVNSSKAAEGKVSKEATRAYLYEHDVVDWDEPSDDSEDDIIPDFMRDTFASKITRVERKKERKTGDMLEGNQYALHV